MRVMRMLPSPNQYESMLCEWSFFFFPLYKLWLAKNDLFCVNKSSNRVITTHTSIPIAILHEIAVCVRMCTHAFIYKITRENNKYA